MIDEKKNKEGSSSDFIKIDGGKTKSNAIEIPSLNLPKGGGAIKGIDEKFTVNSVNGTSSFSIPLPFSKARGISPPVNLSYNSGSGNGICGLGWSLDIPSIKRKTDKKLPQYFDGSDSDTFVLSNAEDLVPEFEKDPGGDFILVQGDYKIKETDSADGAFRIRFYRPRIEGLFARIERWSRKTSGEIRWRMTTRDNVTTLFGWNAGSRVAEPGEKDNKRIFEWLPEFIFDDKGNCVRYIYKGEDEAHEENAANFNASAAHNRNRVKNGKPTYANTYLEKILYGNRTPYEKFEDAYPPDRNYLFSVVFDYGTLAEKDSPDKLKPWDFRSDAFSNYKAGFEIRTTRLCKRILFFHHFTGAGKYDGLVRSLDLKYDNNDAEDFTFLKSVISRGYIKKADGSYSSREYPPTEFEYQVHEWNRTVEKVSSGDIANAPIGLDEQQYQFTDLYNEGLAGILTEQAQGWYYKQNLGNGKFERAKTVMQKPSFAGLGSTLQITDLDADGIKQLVDFNNEPRGFFELDDDDEWLNFRSFKSIPNIDFRGPNTRMLDLNGDGRPDVVITEENVITWYGSEGRDGFTSHQRSSKSFDEEEGPHVVFADATQTIFLADMSGDGLTDIVRIRNRDVCYWPNLGYGKFGAKVTMDNSPAFDRPEKFNPSYIRLADIDGSGTTDIVYLGNNKFTCWKNLSGNRFGPTPFEIDTFPDIHSHAKITAIDLLGRGTTCIVWSSPLSKDSEAPLKYIDLTNGKKPHLMVFYKNNMGKEVSLEYRPSTEFYLGDKLAGRPWVTKLHFPVHCISKTTIEDKITGDRFVSEYKYHHGYYDHSEKEFRGFGMVEQIDSETFEGWKKSGASNVVEEPLHQEPMVSRTWLHTGAFLGKDRILNQFSEEYWYAESAKRGFPVSHDEVELPDALLVADRDLDPAILDNLSVDERRQALRACKGMQLRSEVFAKDAVKFGNTEEAVRRELIPYTVTTKNCVIELLQPKGRNEHAVFVVKESESISYTYERDPADPRIAHNLNVTVDKYGNILESAAVVYPRGIPDASLPTATREDQDKTVIIYTENRFTEEVISADTYRLPVPSEVMTFDLKNVAKAGDYYTLPDFDSILSDTRSNAANYHELNKPFITGKAQRRLIERICSLFYHDDLTGPLPLHQMGPRALSYEKYQLAYSPELLTNIFDTRVDGLLMEEGKFAPFEGDDNWWINSGITQYIGNRETSSAARKRFFMPISYTDPYGAVTRVTYHGNYFLMIEETENTFGNKTRVEKFDYRMLSPRSIRDINGNVTEVVGDELGLIKALALAEGRDSLSGISETTDDAEKSDIRDFFDAPDPASVTERGKDLIGEATSRFVYDLKAYMVRGKPAAAATIAREEHVSQNPDSRVQISFEYSSGLGEVAMKKVQAEPGKANQVTIGPGNKITTRKVDTSTFNPPQIRWVGTGRIVKNNKGNPVKQYEPYFSVNHRYEDHKELVETGVTPIIHYDSPGRAVRTEMPDGTFTKIEFDSWKKAVYDANDTVQETGWFLDRTGRLIDVKLVREGKDPAREKQAADKAAKHANTPSVFHFDTLGRPVLSVEHNRNIATGADEFYQTVLKLDTEGNLRTVTDARGNTVVEYKYDMLGTNVYQNSMDAGQRWLLLNILGNPFRTWDERGHEFQYSYDLLRRPTNSKVLGGDGAVRLDNIFARIIYGESLLLNDRSNEAELQDRNILGQPIQTYDTGGLVDTPDYDFKGKPLLTKRWLFRKYKETANWTDANLAADLEAGDPFTFVTETDALGRNTRQITPNGRVITFSYNEAGLLNGQSVTDPGAAVQTVYINNIDYNEKGRRERIEYGNGVVTEFTYDIKTFRLNRLESKRRNGDPLQDWRYTYDAFGNITHIAEDKIIPIVFFDNQEVAGISEYTYDALYRLVEATGREHDTVLTFDLEDNWNDGPFMRSVNPGDTKAIRGYTENYEYDPAGNILTMLHVAVGNNWRRRYTPETHNNRLIETRIGSNFYSYTHHPKHGFITEMPHLREIGWNFKEELVKTARQRVNPGNGTPETTWYQYDGQGQRIRKITENAAAEGADPTKKEERIYQGGYEVYKKQSGANRRLVRTSLSLMDEGHRFVMIETRNEVDDGTEKSLTRYQLHNHLGSAVLELDGSPAARVISYEEYHPYGTTAMQFTNGAIKAAAKRYRFTGMERDEESGLEYHSARYYLPWLGRWLSADPIGIEGGVNLYAYTSQNPVNATDSSGTSEDEELPGRVLSLLWESDSSPVNESSSALISTLGNPFDPTRDIPGELKGLANPVFKWLDDLIAKTIVNLTRQTVESVERRISEAISSIETPIKNAWNSLAADDAFFEDALEFIGHLTWGLPGTLIGAAIASINLTFGNLVVGIHNIFSSNQDDLEYAGISIGGPNDEDDIIGNYGGFLNFAPLGNAFTVGPFAFFFGSPDMVRTETIGMTSDVKEYYGKYEAPRPIYGSNTPLRTADHEEGHEDQNLVYGPISWLLGVIFSVIPGQIFNTPVRDPIYWYDRQANKWSGKNSPANPNTTVHP